MRIEGKDASSFTYQKSQDTAIPTKETKTITNDNTKENIQVDTPLENLNISQLSPVEKRELPIAEKVVIAAIERANKAISGANTRFEFSIHKKTKEIMIKVIDSDTGDIIREIPPEKTLDMVAKLWEIVGVVVDERR